MQLTKDNYSKGFLVDEELMGGVAANPAPTGGYIAYVLRHTTGEYLGYQEFRELPSALEALNQVQRGWKFETSSGCSSGKCGEGACDPSQCRALKSRDGAEATSCSTGKC